MARAATPKGRSSVEAMVLGYAAAAPELGQFRVAAALHRRGVQISPSGVRAIWKRHQLETMQRRVAAIAGRGTHGVSLSGRQQARLKRAAQRRELLGADKGAGKAKTLRYHLLVVAAQAFHRHGYKGATLKEIAEAAGILPGSIYHYFPSKQELFLQVYAEGFAEANRAQDRAVAGRSEPRERLEAACAAHLELLESRSPLAGFTRSSLFVPEMGAPTRKLLKVRNAYEARFRALVDALELPPQINRKVFRLGLLGALNWSQVWYKHGEQSPAQIAHDLVEIFCRDCGRARRGAARRDNWQNFSGRKARSGRR